jgi:ribosomal protein S18 acetylase RimI-like enzyme
MTAVIARSRTKSSGLRPLEPDRDLTGVANLIQAAFAEELDRNGQGMLREMRSMSRLGPLLWWLDQFSVEFNELFSGFVWVEEGQIVGNVTVSRAAPGSRRWIISNVAVANAYRGRGIAQALMDAAIELVREWHGLAISLQVRNDNLPALHIYHKLGFRDAFGTAYLRLDRVPPVKPPPLDPDRFRFIQFRGLDGRKAYQLAQTVVPEVEQLERPIRRSQYNLGFEDRLEEWGRRLIGGGPALRLAQETRGNFDAIVTAMPGTWWEENRLTLVVHPASKGTVERDLIGHGLRYLGHWSQRATLARHPTYHPEGIEAFKAYGFREERTLIWMKREM